MSKYDRSIDVRPRDAKRTPDARRQTIARKRARALKYGGESIAQAHKRSRVK